jgi:hypothetical protein
MIVTALVAILTIGLSDNENRGDGLSAYSVFNRGFQQLMGSVDVENLVNQHVGGGGMAMAAAGMQQRNFDNNDDFPPARRAVAVGNNNRRNQRRDNDSDNDAPDLHHDNNANDNEGIARKSGKKNRRRDLQQRRDLQNQRRAAIEMGFAGTDDSDVVVQRLIEEQLAAEARE